MTNRHRLHFPLAAALLGSVLSLPRLARADAHGQGIELEFAGYGELNFSWLDYGPNQNRENGAQSDSRLVFDQTRFTFELEGELPADMEFEAEIEFEHGGTGSAMELEYEEFGEYEAEVERGGEVNLEELFLEKRFGDVLTARIGRFYVAMGLLSERFRPTQYLGTRRPEAETTVLPAVWNELGADVTARLGDWRLTLQLVNGLDSTGFSAQRFIASGHQQRFETVTATDLAVVGRVDYTPVPGLTFGTSAYFGGTTRNRPKPDLVDDCADPDPDAVAPCGYRDARLLLLDAHLTALLGPFRGQGMALWGHLSEADAISDRNARLSNALNVPRSKVSDAALAIWLEAGLDLAPWLGVREHRLEPFLRFDYYDTIFQPRASLYDDPRFERQVYTGGLSWTAYELVVAKLDFSRRVLGADRLRSEDAVSLMTGFIY